MLKRDAAGYFVRVQRIGGQLLLAVPASLARELNLARRELLHVVRGQGRELRYRPIRRSPDGRL